MDWIEFFLSYGPEKLQGAMNCWNLINRGDAINRRDATNRRDAINRVSTINPTMKPITTMNPGNISYSYREMRLHNGNKCKINTDNIKQTIYP
jgi:hypothetical protein